jgi:Rrf2 family protein
MLNLSKKMDYALVALACLEQHSAVETPAGESSVATALSARRIADQYGLPVALLMNILKDLQQAGIVQSVRGPSGGYRLAKDSNQISLLDVVHAVDGPVRVAQCTDPLAIVGQGCPIQNACPIRQPIHRLEEHLTGFLDRVTLADLLGSKVDVPVQRVRVDRTAGDGARTRKSLVAASV